MVFTVRMGPVYWGLWKTVYGKSLHKDEVRQVAKNKGLFDDETVLGLASRFCKDLMNITILYFYFLVSRSEENQKAVETRVQL